MAVDPFFNDRATIGVFERAFYAGREAAEEVDAILTWAVRPRRVLDVGCNAGLHALEWARRGVEVVGIDSAPVAIDLARQRAAGDARLRFEVADLADPDLARLGAFDLVTVLGGVFNCVPRSALVPAFRAIRSVLGPAGELVFDVLRWRDTAAHGLPAPGRSGRAPDRVGILAPIRSRAAATSWASSSRPAPSRTPSGASTPRPRSGRFWSSRGSSALAVAGRPRLHDPRPGRGAELLLPHSAPLRPRVSEVIDSSLTRSIPPRHVDP